MGPRLLPLLMWVSLLGCDGLLKGPRSDAGGGPGDAGEVPDDELRVFAEEVWTPARADCAMCHRLERTFAHDDARVAHGVALRLVDFAAPEHSAMAVRSENNHCGTSSCAPGTGRRARLAEGIRRWGLARTRADAGVPDAGPAPEPDWTQWQTCSPSARPSEDVARRLSKKQYVNTVLRALDEPSLLSFTARSGVLYEQGWQGTLVSALAQLPEDGEAEALARQDVRLTDTHLEGLLAVAQGVVDYYANQPARFGALAGSCALGPQPAPTCVRSFVADVLGRRLLSRPLSASELDLWQARYDAAPGTPFERLLELTRAFLLEPELVLGLAWQGPLTPGRNDEQHLTAFEFARALALHYTDEPPSSALYAAAASGALLTDPAVLEQHLEAFAAPGSGSFRFPLSSHHHTFYAFLEQWLDAGAFRGFPSGSLAQAAFPGWNFQAGNENWYGEARDELYSFGFRVMFAEAGRYATFFTDTRGEVGSFTQRIYGAPPGLQELGPHRPGVLSRVGYLASGDVYPNQIIFGVRVMRNVLCQPLPAPDAASLPNNFRDLGLRSDHPQWNTRTFVAQQTSAPACQGCHARINPFGAAISKYDGAGAYDLHTVERVWSTGSVPMVLGTPALDDSTQVLIDGQLRAVTGLSGLASAIAASEEGPMCLARKLFAYGLRRAPSPRDACYLKAMATAARDTSLAEMWKELGRNPAFRTRQITPKVP